MMKNINHSLLISMAFLLFSCTKETGVLEKNLSIIENNAKTTSPSKDITTGLIAYLPFSGNGNDASGNGNNGIVYGATLTTDRKGSKNKAYSFNGISNYIDIPNKIFDNGWENMTFSIWINIDNDTYVAGGRTIFNTVPHNGFDVGYNTNSNKMLFVFKNSDPSVGSWDILNTNTFNFVPAVKTWYHLTVVKSGLNYLYYINGVHDKTVGTSYSPVSYNCSVLIGCIAYYADYFQGKMDEVRIYNRALTNEQIAYLATQ